MLFTIEQRIFFDLKNASTKRTDETIGQFAFIFSNQSPANRSRVGKNYKKHQEKVTSQNLNKITPGDQN